MVAMFAPVRILKRKLSVDSLLFLIEHAHSYLHPAGAISSFYIFLYFSLTLHVSVKSILKVKFK